MAPATGESPPVLRPCKWVCPRWATPALPGSCANCPQGHLAGVVRACGAGQENKLEGQKPGCAVGSEDQALPPKRSWSLSTPLFTWLGFKEVNYFSALALPPRRQIQPFRVGNGRPMRKSARGACSQTSDGTAYVS